MSLKQSVSNATNIAPSRRELTEKERFEIGSCDSSLDSIKKLREILGVSKLPGSLTKDVELMRECRSEVLMNNLRRG